MKVMVQENDGSNSGSKSHTVLTTYQATTDKACQEQIESGIPAMIPLPADEMTLIADEATSSML